MAVVFNQSSVFLSPTNIETSVSGPQVYTWLIHQAQTQKYTSSIILLVANKHHIDSLLPHPSSSEVLCSLHIWKFNLQLYTKVQRWKSLVHNYSHAKNRAFQETENELIMVLTTTTTMYIETREQNYILVHYLLVLLLQYMILLRLWAPPPRGGPTPCCK